MVLIYKTYNYSLWMTILDYYRYKIIRLHYN